MKNNFSDASYVKDIAHRRRLPQDDTRLNRIITSLTTKCNNNPNEHKSLCSMLSNINSSTLGNTVGDIIKRCTFKLCRDDDLIIFYDIDVYNYFPSNGSKDVTIYAYYMAYNHDVVRSIVGDKRIRNIYVCDNVITDDNLLLNNYRQYDVNAHANISNVVDSEHTMRKYPMGLIIGLSATIIIILFGVIFGMGISKKER